MHNKEVDIHVAKINKSDDEHTNNNKYGLAAFLILKRQNVI